MTNDTGAAAAATDRVTALVLAGGRDGRAMLPVGGRPMLHRVIDALHAGIGGGRILVAGDEIVVPDLCTPLAGGETLVDTLMNGVRELKPDETRLLVVTADIPFLTPEAVRDFLQQATPLAADFVYPIVPADVCAQRFPTMRRTTLGIAEGRFTGGNLALLNPVFLRDHESVLRAAYARRKSVRALARLLGAKTVLRLIGSRLSPNFLAIRHIEAAVGRVLGGAHARAVISSFPEIAADIDRAEDIGQAESASSAAF